MPTWLSALVILGCWLAVVVFWVALIRGWYGF
jgi:hypothetical protein